MPNIFVHLSIVYRYPAGFYATIWICLRLIVN